MSSESWESVARALAARMQYQAGNCPYGTYEAGAGQSPGGFIGEEGQFHVPEEHVDDCPHCADTVAYRRFLRKAEQVARRRRTSS